MKIVSWNCNGALRKKTTEIDLLGADILIIQECENPSESTKEFQSWAGEYLWVGTSKNKGVGVFPKNGHKVSALDWNGTYRIEGLKSNCSSLSWCTSDLKLFLPFTINSELTVLGVWTKGNDSEVFSYMGQFWKYLQIHRTELSHDNTLIIGDFNSNKKWDKPDRWWSHSGVIDELSDIGIKSLYHYQQNELQGEETTPTFYFYRKQERPYHIDYVFCSRKLLRKCQLSMGEIDDWIKISDHMPLCIGISS
jgi:exonuclease III